MPEKLFIRRTSINRIIPPNIFYSKPIDVFLLRENGTSLSNCSFSGITFVAIVGVVRPWKSANLTNQGFFPRELLLKFY